MQTRAPSNNIAQVESSWLYFPRNYKVGAMQYLEHVEEATFEDNPTAQYPSNIWNLYTGYFLQIYLWYILCYI